MKASFPGKVGGECCQRDCHREGHRTAEPSVLRLSVSSGLGKWPVAGDGQPSPRFRKDGNKSLFSKISFVCSQSRVITSRTTYRTLSFVHFPFGNPAALASLAANR